MSPQQLVVHIGCLLQIFKNWFKIRLRRSGFDHSCAPGCYGTCWNPEHVNKSRKAKRIMWQVLDILLTSTYSCENMNFLPESRYGSFTIFVFESDGQWIPEGSIHDICQAFLLYLNFSVIQASSYGKDLYWISLNIGIVPSSRPSL